MRKAIFNIHLYAALVFGAFILVLGLTGSVIVFTEEIDRALNPNLFSVEIGGEPLPVAEIRKMLPGHMPGLQTVSLRLPQHPGDTYFAQFKGKHYFINPFNGQLVGVRDEQTLASRLSKLHTSLLMGKAGAAVVHASSIVLLFLVVSGVYLWFPYKRWRIAFTATLRRTAFDMHLALGTFTFVLIGIFAATGIVLSFERETRQLLIAIVQPPPGLGRNVRSQPQPGARPLVEDEAIAAAVIALPDAKPLAVQSPANATASFIVTLRHPEDRTPIGRSWVTIDQHSGHTLAMQSSRTVAAPTRALNVARALHTGDIFGLPSRVVMMFASIIVALQMITGTYLWWKKFRSPPRANPTPPGANA
ncbi:MAG: PepSY-associated TM helix domain-containing protein [Acidobacteriota bacterium]